MCVDPVRMSSPHRGCVKASYRNGNEQFRYSVQRPFESFVRPGASRQRDVAHRPLRIGFSHSLNPERRYRQEPVLRSTAPSPDSPLRTGGLAARRWRQAYSSFHGRCSAVPVSSVQSGCAWVGHERQMAELSIQIRQPDHSRGCPDGIEHCPPLESLWATRRRGADS
jgi:hypothetical protein